MRRTMVLLLVLGLLLCAACAQKKTVQLQTPQEKKMGQVGEKYFKALGNHDLDGIRQLLAEDYEGKQEFLSYLKEEFKEWEKNDVRLANYKPIELKTMGENKGKVTFYTRWTYPGGSKSVEVDMVMSKNGKYQIVNLESDK